MYRIGIDVGGKHPFNYLVITSELSPTSSTGTNTDACILDFTAASSANRGFVASCKTPTTPDVTSGIKNAIGGVLNQSQIDRNRVSNVSIGTTHFINAVIEADSKRLSRVAVVRLCGPYTRKVRRHHRRTETN